MDANEIREMSTDAIESELMDAREELMRLRFQRASGELTDFNILSATRQKIARILTVLNEKISSEGAEVEGEE
ncbi:MAG: 50S ribosomal protein L29 [Chloroflexi bacterium]|nr:50S ribosomal protein L29 [Chloroflexota bacterium]